MKSHRLLANVCLTAVVSVGLAVSSVVAAPPADLLAKITSQADLDTLIAATTDAPLNQALRDHGTTILTAVDQRTHVDAVIRAIESSPGKFEKINATPVGLKKAAGGEIGIFDSLKLVDLAIPNAGPHDHRQVDPYDAAFFEHLGQIASLELNDLELPDERLSQLQSLTYLKSLRLVRRPQVYTAETQAKIKTLLPNVALKFD